jgi:hypothetical protein
MLFHGSSTGSGASHVGPVPCAERDSGRRRNPGRLRGVDPTSAHPMEETLRARPEIPSPAAPHPHGPLRRGLAATLLAAAVLACATPADAIAPPDTARAARWRGDLRFTVDRLLALHPRPFAFTPRAAFDSAAADIEGHLGAWDDRRIAVEMMRMVALIGDGHTMLIGTLPSAGFTGIAPVFLRPFEDGLHVIAAAPQYRELVGGRVRRIGVLDAAAAVERVAGIAGGDNRYGRLDRVPLFLMVPGALHALGIAPDPGGIPLEVETAAGTLTRDVAGGPPPGGFPEAFQETEPAFPPDWVTARAPGELPRSDRRPDDAWWAEHLARENVLYLRLRRIDPSSGAATFSRFLRSAFALADSVRPAGLVVDLRHDHGGNNTILDALVRGIVERPWLDRPGRVLALTDRGTFSAAMNACVFLEWQTEAMFVGEPTGGRPNSYGDADRLETPNFGLLLMVSRWPWSARLPWDDRPWIAPQLAVPSTFADWRERRDPALAAALAVIAHGTVSDQARAAARTGDSSAVARVCRAWDSAHPNPWRTLEPELAAATRRALEDQDPFALPLGQAVAGLFPRSATAWVRLGQAQALAGKRDDAVMSLRRALELDPRSRSARAVLRSLGASAP